MLFYIYPLVPRALELLQSSNSDDICLFFNPEKGTGLVTFHPGRSTYLSMTTLLTRNHSTQIILTTYCYQDIQVLNHINLLKTSS